MSDRIVIFGYSQRDIGVADGLVDFLAGNGYQPVTVTMDSPRIGEDLKAALSVTPCAMICVGWHAVTGISLGGMTLFTAAKRFKIPLIYWNIDHPVMMRRFVPYNDPELIVMNSTISDFGFWRAHFSRDQLTSWTQGCGVSRRQADEAGVDMDRYEDREIWLYAPFNVNWNSRSLEEVEEVIANLPAGLRRQVNAAIEAARTELTRPIAETVQSVFEAHGLYFQMPTLCDLIRLVIYHVQLWRRHQIVEALADFPALIDGEVPEALARRVAAKGHARIVTEAIHERTLARMRNAKLVLSLNFDTRGLHSRVLNAMYSGAVPFIERNADYSELFGETGTVAFYDWSEGGIARSLSILMENPEGLARTARAAHAFIRREGSIDYRFDRFIDLIESTRLRGLELTHMSRAVTTSAGVQSQSELRARTG
ncbi:MAG: glycosyltransferase family 1 protein [Alphaproteobacteria bacterium]|nr:glycosyltransferase family 1 protein [Alphaproteobacteria bacterium]